MAVRLWAGRAGSGKSRRCFDEIVSHMHDDPLGPPIYLIVPKQETFSRERELTCGSNLSGFCRTRILSFELLAEQILGECGGQALPRVTAAGRQMMIGHALRQLSGQLTYYTSTDRQPGLAGQLETLFAELERCGSSETDLLSVLSQLDEGAVDPTLLSKCKDLQLIYQHFVNNLGSGRLDPHQRLVRVLDCIRHATCVKTAVIYIDSFLEFSRPELQMIVALAEVAAEVTVTLLMDPAGEIFARPELNSQDGALFARTEQTYRKLWFALREKNIAFTPERLTTSARFADQSLSALEDSFVTSSSSSTAETAAIELIEASDRRGEVDCAARRIQELTLAGVRYRDIAVLAREVEEYADDINSSFAEHRIPLFMDRRRSATHHPLIRMIRSVLQIALHRFPHDALMGLAKTGLVNLPREHADALENYALLHRLTPAAWADPKPWTATRKVREGEDESVLLQRETDRRLINSYRDTLVNPLRPLVRLFMSNNRLIAREYATELHKTLRRFKTPEALQAWIDNADASIEDRDTHLQTWREWVALIDQLVAVIGDAPLTASEFSNVLLTGLDQLDLALAPPTLDSIIVGSIERARGNRPKVVIAVGMTDAQFPRSVSEDSLLNERERRTLESRNVALSENSSQRLMNERLIAYLAMTRASERLILTRAVTGPARQLAEPSMFWSDVKQLFPALQPQRCCDPYAANAVGSPRQLATGLMNWAKLGATNNSWATLYQWFASAASDDKALAVARNQSWRALSYDNSATIDPQTAARLTPLPLRSSVSRIETFAACPYKHFVRYGLRLAEQEDDQITAVDIGNAYHTLMDELVGEMIERRADWSSVEPGSLRPRIDSIAQQVGTDLRNELMLDSARNRFALETVKRTVSQVMAAQTAAGRRGQLVPWKTELTFDLKDADLPPLELITPAGRKVLIRGRIDRVDRQPGSSLFAVFDYKLGERKLSFERVVHGLSLQLLIYLTVIRKHGSLLAGAALEPIGALYVPLARKLENLKHPREATPLDDPNFDLKVKPRGVFDAEFARSLDTSLAAGTTSQVIHHRINQTGEIGKSSDSTSTAQLQDLLGLAERTLAMVADRIVDGVIEVKPYKLGDETPCPNCSYRSVCRFDRNVNRYLSLDRLSREQVLDCAQGGVDE